MIPGRQPYRREMSRYGWFLRQSRYLRYMAREITCVFIGAYAVVLLVGLRRISEGRQAYESFLQALTSPAGVVFQLIILVFAVYHSMTWFNVTPKAMPLQIGEDFLPGKVIIGAHYVGWLAVTAIVLLLAGVV